jgi:hypothetical protein
MKWIKQFESFNDVDVICKKYGIENYTINSDGSIDVNGGVDISDKNLTKIPLKFRDVSGDFNCYGNQLTTLEGSPKSVGGDFNCGNNKLTTLESSPKSVGVDFSCGNNQLTTLEGSPESVGGDFYCYNNQLVDLSGFPEYYDGDVYYRKNPVSEILDLFMTCKLGRVIDLINEFDVIRGDLVILDRLEEVFYSIGVEVPEGIRFSNYRLDF